MRRHDATETHMNPRHDDGSAGDADYGAIGGTYSAYRRPDPRIGAMIAAALGDARTVLNVGAGAGSYEPLDRAVTAVEPSASMRAQRPAHLARAIDAVAESLPFPDAHFDAAMALYTVHQWPDLARGLAELRRVTRGPIVVMSGDPIALQSFWLADYARGVIDVESGRCPPIDAIARSLGGNAHATPVPIPLECTDGFNEAYYGRPERLLDPGARLACSSWSFVGPDMVERFDRDLRRDLADGTWDARYGHLRRQTEYVGSLRLVVGTP